MLPPMGFEGQTDITRRGAFVEKGSTADPCTWPLELRTSSPVDRLWIKASMKSVAFAALTLISS